MLPNAGFLQKNTISILESGLERFYFAFVDSGTIVAIYAAGSWYF
jgi:hypothetical protein